MASPRPRAWTRSGSRTCSPGSRRPFEARSLPDVHEGALQHIEVVEGVARSPDGAQLGLAVAVHLDAGRRGDGPVEPLEARAAATQQDALALDVAPEAGRGVGEDGLERLEDGPQMPVEARKQLCGRDREAHLARFAGAGDLDRALLVR